MTIITARRGPELPVAKLLGRGTSLRARGRGMRRGFTLAELMVSCALGSIVLAAVLTAFLFFCRAGVRMAHYADMERQSRVVLQRFGQDAREAESVVWVNASTLRFSVNGTTITYGYDATTRRLTRTPAGGSASVLVSGIAGFHFTAYNAAGGALTLTASGASDDTKMVQVDIDLGRNTASMANASAQAVSARYVLRNKATG